MSAQEQTSETCDALEQGIAGADESPILGECTRDEECLGVTCEGQATTMITIFPCEMPIRVNFVSILAASNIDININVTETSDITIGFGSSIEVVLEPTTRGIRLGVSIELVVNSCEWTILHF